MIQNLVELSVIAAEHVCCVNVVKANFSDLTDIKKQFLKVVPIRNFTGKDYLRLPILARR